jgi:FkbM family methyltransferase
MRKIQFHHLSRIIEVWRCFRLSQNPFSILHHYLSPENLEYPFELTLKNGAQIEVKNFHDLVTIWVVNFRQEYMIPRHAETILDVGGNIGIFSLYAQLKNPKSKIVTVEPFPETFFRLRSNIAANNLEGSIDCWNLGVASCSGVRTMSDSGPSQSRGILPVDSEPDSAEHVQVSVVSFEELIQKACKHFNSDSIDFVKVDIEGGEHEALKASSPHSLLPIRHLGMEYHPNQSKCELFEHLQSAGLQLVHDRVFGSDVGVAHFCRVEIT